ncbi:MAG: hypothetical protein AAFN10_14240 [Bacteroidota bacterium]
MPIQNYQKDIFKKTQLRANWELSKNLNLGDVGYMNDGVFTMQTTLKDLGIDFTVRKGIKQDKLDLSSEQGVNVHPKFDSSASAEVIEMTAQVIFDIEFHKAKSYVFKAAGIRTDMISNIMDVGKAVLKKYQAEDWDDDLVIIAEIKTADSVSVLISNESGTKTQISATGNLDIKDLDIAKADIGMEANSNKKLALEILGKPGTNPLFKVMGLEKSLLSKLFKKKPKIVARGLGDPAPQAEPSDDLVKALFVEKGEIED